MSDDTNFGAMRSQLGSLHANTANEQAAVRAVLLRYANQQLTADEVLTVLAALGIHVSAPAEPAAPALSREQRAQALNRRKETA